ncbi:MAG: dTDP-glucose 4,6-dehydratase [Myxococcota bacterium]
MRLLVTGGAGFIGSNFVLHALARAEVSVVTLDTLTYAGHKPSLAPVLDDPRHTFVHGDVRDRALLDGLFNTHRPDAVVHFAAESHVDRSIDGPAVFADTNVTGTVTLLSAAVSHWRTRSETDKARFRFLQISTDEVYGDLGEDGVFTEQTPLAPSSPYAASKAAADHFVSAFRRTYGLPTMISRSSNNYGPRQFPEKLIPLMTLRALRGQPLPVYGDGQNVRDWIHVDDHCRALLTILSHGQPGLRYNVGARCERTNLDIVRRICDVVDTLRPEHAPSHRNIAFVADRPGHDRRYAIDPSQLEAALGWAPQIDFDQGLAETISWYADNTDWVTTVRLDAAQRRRGLGRSVT